MTSLTCIRFTRTTCIAITLLSALGLVQAAAATKPLTTAEMFAKVSPSVWRVTTYDVDGLPLSQGSAVVVGPEALVTNCHVLRRAKRVAVRQGTSTITATLALWDVQRDVCQLKAPGVTAPPVVLGEAARMVVGQEVFAIGHPKGLELTMSAGLISSFRRNDKDQLILIQTSAAISAGSSGGGLFDASGTLMGLTTIGSVGADTQNLNFAIPADWVRELPERHARLTAPKAASGVASGSSAEASDSVAAASAPPIAAALSKEYALNDTSKLPYASDRMRERYALFLTRPLPRAFVISEGGEWRQAWGGPASPADRALKECEALKRGRCFVYAVDNAVVYRPASGSSD
jgi:serine protease Do